MSLLRTVFPWFTVIPALLSLVSCAQMGPADREFRNRAAFAQVDDEGIVPEEMAVARSSAKDPSFETLDLTRPLDPSLLRPPSGAYLIGPGDELDIEVAENAATRTRTKVMPDGMLYYNTARGINARGRTVKEISELLSKQLEGDYVKPVVTVNVSKADSQRYWMLGQVARAGTYPITKPTTLIDAISAGSGLLSNRNGIDVTNPESADLSKAALIRNNEVLPVNFLKLINEGDMSQNVYIQGGDYIFIPSLTARSVYVLGHVHRPGPVFYEPDITLLSALASGGGPKPEAIVTKALVIRGGHTNPKVAVVNVRRIMKGQEPDLRIEGGDIIWVPRSNWSKLKNYTQAVLNTAAQAVAVQEGLGVLGATGGAGITINAGG